MNSIILKQGFTLVTILVAITFVVLSTATNSWASERSNLQNNDSESQVRSKASVNSDIYKTPISGKDSSGNDSQPTRVPTVGKAKISVVLKVSKTPGGNFMVNIEGNNPTPSSFVLGPGYTNPDVQLYPGDYKVKIEWQNVQGQKFQHDIVLSNDCSGKISAGQHKTCEVEIYLLPHIVVYTKATAKGTKASDFTIEATANNPIPSKFPGNEEGTDVYMKFGKYKVDFKPVNGFYAEPPFCYGEIKDDGSPNAPIAPKDTCYLLIDISKLKVIVKVDGGPTPVSSFKYKIITNDETVNGKVYNANAQGTEIPIAQGSLYTVQVLPYSTYDPTKAGNCGQEQAELGKIKVCTITMTYNVEKDTCHLEINEQGKPVKVC